MSAAMADMGLTKDESSRYQQLAAMPAEHFETAVATAKESASQVTTAFMFVKRRSTSRKVSRSFTSDEGDCPTGWLFALVVDARSRHQLKTELNSLYANDARGNDETDSSRHDSAVLLRRDGRNATLDTNRSFSEWVTIVYGAARHRACEGNSPGIQCVQDAKHNNLGQDHRARSEDKVWYETEVCVLCAKNRV